MLIEFSLVKPHHMKDLCFNFQAINCLLGGGGEEKEEERD